MRILIGLLLFSNCITAQSIYFPNDSSVIKEIDLPSEQPFDSTRGRTKINSPYLYLISDHDVYNLFGYTTYMKFYKFNFTDYHILGELKCEQCLLVCRHNEGFKDCHRNRCDEKWIWVMRDNKKSFDLINSSSVLGHDRQDLPRYNDTIITKTPDTAIWYTTGRGDCHASFSYTVLADRYRPVLLLKEKNYWGGCRAGGVKAYMISFKRPAGKINSLKRTVLMPKRNDGDIELE